MQDLSLLLAGGSVTGEAALEGSRVTARLAVKAVALRPFAKLAGQRLAGTLDATAELDGPASAAAGTITLHGRGLKFFGLGETARQLPPVDVNLGLTPGAGRAGIQSQIAVQGAQLIGATGSMPLVLSARPLAVAVPQSGELRLDVSGAGKLEKLVQILPLGEDRMAGDYSIGLAINGTPARPAVSGKVAIAHGSYLNQTFGTELRNLSLDLTGDQTQLQLTRLSAQDSKSGQLQGSGRLELAGSAPRLDIQAKLTDFLIANSDEAEAPVNADLRASGALGSPSLFGRVTLHRSEFRIPDSLPPSIANLQVIEIDSRDPQRTARVLAAAAQSNKAAPAVPMALDVEVTAPGQVFVRGHGLNSEWRGKVTVTGTTAAQSIGGSLTAVRGTFNLLGKDFVIQRGTIRFPTGSFEEAWLDLVATYSSAGITAEVTLTGSLTAPKLALTSTPELPQDQILARVLFGTDAGHITTSQGLQLAFAARTLASGQPGMLDQLRSTLGLDRLDIGSGSNGATSSTSTSASSLPTVSGGKYIAPGVYVGVEQGTTAQSSRAKVEVDLLPHVTGYSSVGADSSNRVGFDWRMDY
jgi:translocation and assembly module TamB